MVHSSRLAKELQRGELLRSASIKGFALTKDDLIPTAKWVATSKRLSLREWIDYVGILIQNRPYSTKHHEYLDQIIDDLHPDQTFQKAAQVGISTIVLIKSLWVAEHLGKKAVYYFQDDRAVSDFSSDRAEPMISSNVYLSERVRETNRVGLRQIGPGSLYFRGMGMRSSRGNVKSVDADFVILDELDEALQSNVEFATDRLMHSDLQWVHALSQPSVPGFGISKRFDESDQHYWHLICPACGEYNCLELLFPDNFIPIAESKKKSFIEGATHYRGCRKCESRLDPSQGVWIAKHPNRVTRGYHLSQLYTQIKPTYYPNVATKIMAEYESKRRSQLGLENFTISVLGFPFAGGHVRVTDQLLDMIEGDYGFSHQEFDAYMGVDQGDVLTIAIGLICGKIFKFVYFEETEDWGRLDFLMNRFGVRYCVIDAMPNKHSAKGFAIKYPNRVSIQYFNAKGTSKIGIESYIGGDYGVPTIAVDRTDSLDAMIDRMEMGEVTLPSRKMCSGKNLTAVEEVRRHLKQLISKHETNASGIMRKAYLRGPGIDNHYGMAMNSALVAAYELGVLSGGPMVVPVFNVFAAKG